MSMIDKAAAATVSSAAANADAAGILFLSKILFLSNTFKNLDMIEVIFNKIAVTKIHGNPQRHHKTSGKIV